MMVGIEFGPGWEGERVGGVKVTVMLYNTMKTNKNWQRNVNSAGWNQLTVKLYLIKGEMIESPAMILCNRNLWERFLHLSVCFICSIE